MHQRTSQEQGEEQCWIGEHVDKTLNFCKISIYFCWSLKKNQLGVFQK